MTDKEITAKIYELLDERYAQYREHAAIRELRCGTGYSGLNLRSIDYLVISTNAGNLVDVFEVKASRADFLKDIASEEKQKQARCFATRFWYVAPRGVVKDGELPAWAGLYEFDHDRDGRAFIGMKTQAPTLQQVAPTWGLVASVIRHDNNSKIDKLLEREKYFLKEEYSRKNTQRDSEVRNWKYISENLKRKVEELESQIKELKNGK